jgi:hypothetical protein
MRIQVYCVGETLRSFKKALNTEDPEVTVDCKTLIRGSLEPGKPHAWDYPVFVGKETLIKRLGALCDLCVLCG